MAIGAANSSYSAGLSAPSVIEFMTVGFGYARVQLESMTNIENCANQAYYVLEFTGQYQEVYSAILAYRASGSEIYFHLAGCFNDMPKITHVYLK